MHLLDEIFHYRFGQIPEGHRRQIGEAEVENLRRQLKETPVGLDIPERLQRQKDAARAGA